MNKVTIKLNSAKTLVFFDVTNIEKTTTTLELYYNKKNGGTGIAILPWSSIEILYIWEQPSEKID